MNLKHLDKKKMFWWVATIVLMIGIFIFSSQPSETSSSLSGDIVEKFLKPILEFFHIKYSEIFHTIVRKTAHFTFYGLLGMSTYNLIQTYHAKKSVILSLLVCFFYACTDEFHQTFVPGRSGEFRDVCIDLGGSLFAILIVLFFSKLKRPIKNRSFNL